MTKTALLTLGRLPKALDIARALHGAGWRVIIAEPFRTHLCAPSKLVHATFQVPSPVSDENAYLDALEQITHEQNVSLVVPVSEEALFAAGLKSRLPNTVQYFGPGCEAIRALHNKERFVQTAKTLGLAVPETARLGTDDAFRLAQTSDVVCKRIFSSAGIGVEFIDRGAPLPNPSDQATLVQRKLPGRARNTVSIAHEGRVIQTVAYEGTIMSHTVSVAFRRIDAPDLNDWIDTFVAAQNYTGFIAFDFIDDEDGTPHAIECNPRGNSGLHYLDPASFGQALTAPEESQSIALRPELLLQQFFPCLTETQGSVFNPIKRKTNWHYLRRSKDVTFSGRDPWPFILMTWTSRPILSRAIFKGESFGEAAVADIAYTGPNAPRPDT